MNDNVNHGTYSAYSYRGCRCQICRDFMSAKKNPLAKRRRSAWTVPVRRKPGAVDIESERMPWPSDYSSPQPFSQKK